MIWKCPHCGSTTAGFQVRGAVSYSICYGADGTEGEPEHEDYDPSFYRCAADDCQKMIHTKEVEAFLAEVEALKNKH